MDESRTWGPPFLGHESAYFLSSNRNKRSITLNIRTGEGQDILRKLIRRADVVIENFRPGWLAQLGFDYEAIRALRPDVIYAAISGFGRTGPRQEEAAYDLVLQGMGGLMSVTGTPEGGPTKIGVGIADLTAGLLAAFAIVAALHHRARTGEGQMVETSLLAGQVALLTNLAASYLANGQVPRRLGNDHPNMVPYGTYATADACINIACGSDGLWRRFCKALALEPYVDDPRFADNADRVRNRSALAEILEPRLRALSTAEALRLLSEAGVPAGPIFDVGEVLEDPQTRAQGLRQTIEHGTLGPIEIVGVPYGFSATPASVRRAPPSLGQHTEEILGSLGYTASDLADLRERGII